MKKGTGYKGNEDTRIWCEYCRIFVYNNRINREKHDNSPQHQANFKKKVEALRKDEEETKRLQNNINTSKPSAKSFYNNSITNTTNNSTINQPTNILSLKSSSKPVEKKPILGLTSSSSVSYGSKPKNSSASSVTSSPTLVDETKTKTNLDIKSTVSDLKRKIIEDEFSVVDKVKQDTQITETFNEEAEEVSVDMLNMFKKKKTTN